MDTRIERERERLLHDLEEARDIVPCPQFEEMGGPWTRGFCLTCYWPEKDHGED